MEWNFNGVYTGAEVNLDGMELKSVKNEDGWVECNFYPSEGLHH